MKFQLEQAEIEQAIIGHIERMGVDIRGKEFDMSFLAGRKGNGVSCSVVMSNKESLIDKLDDGKAHNLAALGDTTVSEDANVDEEEATETVEDTESDATESVESNTTGSIFGNNS